MAQKQQNITISAPGFGGLNTEVSPTEQGEAFASIADNCVIDRYGRIASRKGFEVTTSDGSAFGGEVLEAVHEFLGEDGSTVVFSAADLKIFKGEDIPADVTPATTVTANHWQMITFNDQCFFLQREHAALVYDRVLDTVTVAADVPEANCGVAAYGRLWVADIDADQQTVYWSDLLVGTDFTNGSAGSINVSEYWPRGYDTITGIAAHNGFLIIFGKESILVYSGMDTGTPAADLTLVDSVNGIGCIARDTITPIGTDLFFLDESGVRSFARTIQEKSMPIGEVSRNVRSDVLRYIADTVDRSTIHAVYSPEESFYVVIFGEFNVVFCFSTKQLLEDGVARTTFWPGVEVKTAHSTSTGRLLIGGTARLGQYAGYSDAGETYKLRYYSNPFSFGSSVNLKFPKQVDFTLISGSGGSAQVFWAFDYSSTYRSKTITLTARGVPAYFGIAEFNESEYTGGVGLDRIKANVGGSGVVVTIGIETDINQAEFSIQEMNIQALLGRIT